MAIIDEVKAACDRLAPLGWRDLLLGVTKGGLDIAQATPAALKNALGRQLASIDRTTPGFEDFHGDGAHGIAQGQPARSLLYHAFASPRVVRGHEGGLLKDFPTLPEIEAVENLVFGFTPPTLASLAAGGAAKGQLAITVFAIEYRPAADTPDGISADLVFSRTGIARVGTARPKYLPDVRGCWPEDEDNAHAFRVVPVRLSAWLAVRTKGDKARVMNAGAPIKGDAGRSFWMPVHKLFDGPDCLQGLDLTLEPSGRFFNMKLQRVRMSLNPAAPPEQGEPYVVERDLADVVEGGEFGRMAVVPTVHEGLVRPAIVDGKPLTYTVPANPEERFATYSTPIPTRSNREIHRFPAYVHARTMVAKGGQIIDLNEEDDLDATVRKGGYEALLYKDFTGEGWVDVDVAALAKEPQVARKTRPAYILLSAPDFFPSCGQRELTRWAASQSVPASFRNGNQLWGVRPTALSQSRLPANLQLPDSPFDAAEDTMTAVVAMGSATKDATPPAPQSLDVVRASTLPDDGAGEFAPGWDVSVDVKGDPETGILHFAAYGLGSPFPEDAKLCAALSTFWPAVAPDVYRTFSPHTGNDDLWGTVAPLTDEEIGQAGTTPWDGIPGPRVVRMDDQDFVEMASFLHADYVRNTVENRFSGRLTARITAEEYQRRVLCAARVHWALSGGFDVVPTRRSWLILSFRRVSPGDPELIAAQNDASHVFKSDTIYRAEMCFVGRLDPTRPSPKGPRFRLLPLRRQNSFFVAPNDAFVLRRRASDPTWGRAKGE